MAKEFPIQSVSFRGERDQFLTEGGGSKALPKWVTDDAVVENAHRVSLQLSDMSSFFEHESTLPLLTEVSMHSKATAKSHRPSVRSLFEGNNQHSVLGVSSVGKLLVKIDSKRDLDIIQRRFITNEQNLTDKRKIGLAAVENLKKYEPIVDTDIRDAKVLKLQLVDYQNNEFNDRSQMLLEAVCGQYDVNLSVLNYSSNLRLFALTNVSEQALSAIVTMDSVLAVRKMPTIVFEASPEPDNTVIEIMNPIEGVDYPLVGLLDTGVSESCEHLTPWMIEPEVNAAELMDDDIDRRHGTAVASVLNYGDLLESQDMTQCGPCKILSCVVNTSPDRAEIMEHELIMNIQKAIALHPEVKIWNLSQGTRLEIKDEVYSDFAMALDSLQSTNRILICKSAGNVIGDSYRITHGADSLLSLVVGSIAHKKITEREAEVNDRSPFSRIGPGVENAVKPDLVHYGGNQDTHLSLLSEWGRQYCLDSGTSFSTPRVAALAANLYSLLGEDVTPLLVKAIMVHHANYSANVKKTFGDLRKEMGFGLPEVIDNMLNNDRDECTMVFRHTLEKGHDIVSLDFPYPQSMVTDGFYDGEITVTLAVNPILDASQGNEYCQSQIDVLLETYDHVVHVPLQSRGVFRNPDRMSNDAANVLNQGHYAAKSFKTEYAKERVLIEQGFKYQPIKKYHVDLSKMKPAQKKKILTAGKNWALKLRGLYREAAEQSMFRDGVVLSQDVVVIVTIKDSDRRGVAYGECIQQLQERGYVHNDLRVREKLYVDNE